MPPKQLLYRRPASALACRLLKCGFLLRGCVRALEIDCFTRCSTQCFTRCFTAPLQLQLQLQVPGTAFSRMSVSAPAAETVSCTTPNGCRYNGEVLLMAWIAP